MKITLATTLIALSLCLSAAAQTSDPNAAWTTSYGSVENEEGGTRTNPKSAWDYSTDATLSVKTEYATTWSLIVRCSHGCEVFFTPEKYEMVEGESNTVLVKFNDKPVKRYAVTRSQDGKSYFFSDPIAILRAIRDNGGYMTIEYKPYEKIAQTVKYEIWNLPPTILKRIDVQGLAQDKARKALKAECDSIDEQMSNLYAYSADWMTLRYKQIDKCGGK